MNLIRKIEIDEAQAAWFDAEIANGNIPNEGEFINDLLAEAKLRKFQPPQEIAKIRDLLDEADKEGNSTRDPDAFWNEILATK